ncbi:MAG: J domain-containing protein [Planctomycetota bacterium]
MAVEPTDEYAAKGDDRRSWLGAYDWQTAAPWLIWLGFTVVYLATLTAVFGLGRVAVWAWPGPMAFGWLVFLHCRTNGDTSPIAVFTFLATGPMVGVFALFVLAAQERIQMAVSGNVSKPLSYTQLSMGAWVVGCAALLLSGVVAFLYARAACGLWPSKEKPSVLSDVVLTPDAAGRPPQCLAEFALDWSATPEELDAAYRAMALKTHPDRGGSEQEFKALQENYARAKRFLRRTRVDAPHAAASRSGASAG